MREQRLGFVFGYLGTSQIFLHSDTDTGNQITHLDANDSCTEQDTQILTHTWANFNGKMKANLCKQLGLRKNQYFWNGSDRGVYLLAGSLSAGFSLTALADLGSRSLSLSSSCMPSNFFTTRLEPSLRMVLEIQNYQLTQRLSRFDVCYFVVYVRGF